MKRRLSYGYSTPYDNLIFKAIGCTTQNNKESMEPKEIKEIREAMGLTQEQFAVALGSTHCTINRWEMSKCKVSPYYKKELRKLRDKHVINIHG